MTTKALCTLLVVAGLSFTPAYADDWVTISQSTPLVVTNAQKAVNSSESINVPKGVEKLQLYLTYYDGSDTAPSYRWLRVSSASMSFLTEKQFQGQKTLTMNVSGELTWGGNQILVSGAGPVGATFNWALRTPRPVITGVSPDSVFSGGTITISGTNFCPHPSYNQVTIGSQPARIVSATTTQLVVEVPEEAKSGTTSVSVKVAGIDLGPVALSVDVQAAPYLTSLDKSFVAPGMPLTITGEGFNGKAEVYIGPFQAQIVHASPTNITVIAPAPLSDPWYAPNLTQLGAFYPVKVIVNGVKSRNTLSVRASDVG